MTIKNLYPTQRPALDLNFARAKRLDPRVSLTRASVGTYVGNDGLIKYAAAGEARFDHDPVTGESLGLLREDSRSNLLLNSETLATQNVTVTAVAHTLSFYGTGTVTLSGTHSATVVGAGVYPARVNLTFTPTAGTLTVTVSGTVEYANLEIGSFPTSYIPTAGSTVTRAADVASLTNTNVYDTDSFTILNDPYGAAAGGSTLNIVGGGQTPVKRTTVYNQELSQSQINTLVKKDDEFWRWRILGSSFALPSFLTDGQVTVDWGDGTVETLTTSEHTFSDGGGYHDVGFRLDNGTYFRPDINNNATHKDKVIALGPAPESMKLDGFRSFNRCSNLEAFDATVDATGGTNFSNAWRNCSSLTSFPLIDTSSGTVFTDAWNDCSSLTSFPLIDTSSATNFQRAWQDCSSLTSFPLIDTSSATGFPQAWKNCSSLTSFPLIDASSVINFRETWRSCSSLTSFPLIDISSGTVFYVAWQNCSSLTDFPANFFDSWTGTPVNDCFQGAWQGCTSLTATSVENILNSIDTSGQSAPASNVNITIDYDAGTGTPSVSTAVTNLKSRGWTITLNGVAQ